MYAGMGLVQAANVLSTWQKPLAQPLQAFAMYCPTPGWEQAQSTFTALLALATDEDMHRPPPPLLVARMPVLLVASGLLQ
jgi:hypothetical protein